MVLSASDELGATRLPELAPGTAPELVWHELECGCYRADLPLWRELAETSTGPILDVGAGGGRVALELAGRGHEVTALDLSPVLLEGLRWRAGQAHVQVQTVCADARSFTLERPDFGLCIVPMQTVQLLGGRTGRLAFMERARAHLRPGGMLACAIVSELEPFDCAEGDTGPAPETIRVGGMLYVSRATRVAQQPHSVVIERERRIVPEREHRATASEGATAGLRPVELDLIELDSVSASELEREGVEAGLRPERAREIAATDEHVGSIVVMLRA